jgi:hypothetical protein
MLAGMGGFIIHIWRNGGNIGTYVEQLKCFFML